MPLGDGSLSWDFFVSYTQADRAWAEWIAWQVEEAGYRALVQAWDIVPGDNWVSRMDEGVARAARTIAVVSPDYLTSVYGTAEWQAAWRDDPLGQKRKLLPVRVAETERQGLLAQIVDVDLVGLPEPDARRRVHAAITAAMTGRAKPATAPGFPGADRAVVVEPRFPGALPPVWDVPPRNPNFTGRDGDIARLREALRSRGTVAAVAVAGMGGIGKTQLATEYLYRHATDYDLVWWITAEEIPLVVTRLAELAATVGLPEVGSAEDAAAAVLAHLRGISRWLVIYDNAEAPEMLQPLLPVPTGHVLITTRRSGYDAIAETLDVDTMPRDESVAFLHRRLPAVADADLDRLASTLGDLPLALEQAAAYLRKSGTPVGDYLRWLTDRPDRMLAAGAVAGRPETLATLWKLSCERIADKHPAALQLLRVCAFLAPDAIPLSLFTDHPGLLPEPLRTIAVDQIDLADTVAVLVDYSLVRRSEHHLGMHRLVQTAVRHLRPSETPDDPAFWSAGTTALDLLTAATENPFHRPESWAVWSRFLPHALATLAHMPDAAGDDVARLTLLLTNAAGYLRMLGRPLDAQPLLERALTIDEATYGPDHPTAATHRNNLATVLRDLGRPADALLLLERALAIGEASHGPDHPVVASRLNNLAMVLKDLDRASDAQPLLERALTIDEATYGPDHPEVATDLNNLAIVLQDLGRPEDSRPLLERALTIDETTYGPNHPNVANRLNNLAVVLQDLGRPEDAQPLLERALTIDETTYGPNHPTVAGGLNNLATVLQDLGRPADAQPLLERARAINDRSQRPAKP
jgi:tetratricopeptide (TPR) repeat protein